MNVPTIETIRQVFPRGTQVICEGAEANLYGSCEGRVAAAQDNIVHIHFFQGAQADAVAAIGQHLSVHRVTANSRYTANAVRIENAVPGGITVRILSGPSKSERREYLRVRCQLPFHWKLADKNTLVGLKEASQPISETRQQLDRLAKSVDNPQLSMALLAIFERLDRLEDTVDRMMEKMQEDGHTAEDVIIELSGGGMRFLTQRRLKKGDIIDVHLRFDADGCKEDLHLQAKVLRIHPPNLGRSQPSVACQFITIHSRDRESIIRYTFRVQRELLRRSV